MIEWIKEKFASLISLFFVLFVITSVIIGSVIGYIVSYGSGIIVGGVIGFVIGILLGIICFGLLATIINISTNTDFLLNKVDTLLREYISTSNLQKKTVYTAPTKQDFNGFNNKEDWISTRILKLISDGYSPSDAKILSETEYITNKTTIEKISQKEKQLNEKIEEFKDNNKGFIYSEHEKILEDMKNAKEIVEYLKSLNIQNETFAKTIIPEIEKLQGIEYFHGNCKKDAIEKLKKLTATN